MINKAKISIILPVYNVEKFLRRCLDTLVNQTYQNIEIIAVVDASPDDSLTISEEYAHKDARLIVKNLVQNAGVANARNVGIAISTGDYIMFVDSDDYVELDMLDRYWAEMDQEYDLVVTGMNVIHLDGNSNQQLIPKPFTAYQLKEFSTVYPELDESGLLMGPYNKLYKKSIFVENNIVFPELSLGEDQCFVLEYLLNINAIKICEFSSYNYIRHLSPTISKGIQRSFDALHIFLDLKFRLKNELLIKIGLPIETDEIYYKNNLIIYGSAIIALYSPKYLAPPEKRKDELKKFRKSKIFKLYKKQDFGKRLNLVKIPVCYLPISVADWVMKKFIGQRFSK